MNPDQVYVRIVVQSGVRKIHVAVEYHITAVAADGCAALGPVVFGRARAMVCQPENSRAINPYQHHFFIEVLPHRLPVWGEVLRIKAGIVRTGALVKKRYRDPSLGAIPVAYVRCRPVYVNQAGDNMGRIHPDCVDSSSTGAGIFICVRNSAYNSNLIASKVSAHVSMQAAVKHMPI